jgi:hypothetical protein
VGSLARLFARYLLRRSRSRPPARRFARRTAGRGARYGARGTPRERSRAGFFGPLPYYSTRTRSGSRVTVTGCCLPLALAPLAVSIGAAVLLRRLRA